MYFHPDLIVPMIICKREWSSYGVLNPTGVSRPAARLYPKQDHCESCGRKDGRLLRHPDPTTVMTIYIIDYNYYLRHGRLNPNLRANHPTYTYFHQYYICIGISISIDLYLYLSS